MSGLNHPMCRRLTTHRSKTVQVRQDGVLKATVVVPPVDDFNQTIEDIDAEYYAVLKAKYIIGVAGSGITAKVVR